MSACGPGQSRGAMPQPLGVVADVVVHQQRIEAEPFRFLRHPADVGGTRERPGVGKSKAELHAFRSDGALCIPQIAASARNECARNAM